MGSNWGEVRVTGFLYHLISLEGTHTIVYTANVDIVPGLAAPGPGIKQTHLLLFGFRNPDEGVYDIKVVAETGPGGAVETGIGRVEIVDSPQPSISVTSAFNAGSPNTIYQSTATNSLTSLAYDFLLWDGNGLPFTGITIEPVNSTRWDLVKGNQVVGQVVLQALRGATGQELTSGQPSFEINSPVSGVATARLTAQFKTGDALGDYILVFSMNDGNSVVMFVTAN